MSEYLYEMHLHTCIASACGRIKPQDVVEIYLAMGYTGVFVTEHFLNGNTAVDRSLPWADKITAYTEGYRQVAESAKGSGLDVFFGVEYHVGYGAEMLLYGITPEWLYQHEEIMSMSAREVLDFFRKNGILVIQAHPMRVREYTPFIPLFPYWVDGIEVYNVNNQPVENDFASDYAARYGLKTVCGSDLHSKRQSETCAFVLPERLSSPDDLRAVLESGHTGMRLIKNRLCEDRFPS